MKRHLNKIIFINSASTPYAEVRLNGNIHFVGSNGFGKTTVLRTILFFYNPTTVKRELGIREDQQSFAEYYFEHLNSYLLYEVSTGTGYFLMMVFRKSGGRLHFRLIDTPYEKGLFTTNTGTGVLAKSYEEVLQGLHAKGIYISDEIAKHSTCKNILYGIAKDKALRRFCIFQTNAHFRKSGSLNISKNISNIFNSSRLDSNHLKSSIIQAIIEEQFKIDFATLNRHLGKFKKDLKDVELFESHHYEAEGIVEVFEKVQDLEKQLKVQASRLGNALRNSQKKLDAQTEEVRSLEEERTAKEENFQKKAEAFKTQQDHLKKALWEVQRNLEQCTELETWYEENKEKVVQIRKKSSYEQQEKVFQEDLQSLTAAIADVQRHYENRRTSLLNDRMAFQNGQEQKKNEYTARLNEKLFSIENQKQAQSREIIETQKQATEEVRAEIEELRIQRTEARHQQRILEKQGFLKEEQEEVQQKVRTLHALIQGQTQEIRLKQSEISSAQQLYENQQESFQKQADALQKNSYREQETLRAKIIRIEEKLEGFEGSLLEFLHQHYPDWEQTIGKVCAEDVLFMKDLQPSLQQETLNLYGVEIELTAIAREIPGIEALEQKKKGVQQEIDRLEKEFQKNRQHLQQEQQKWKEDIQKKVKIRQQEAAHLKLQKEQAILQQRELELQVEELKEKAREQKATALQEWQQKESAVEEALQVQKNVVEKYLRQETEKLKECTVYFEALRKAAQKSQKEQIQALEEEAREYTNVIEMNLQDMEEEEREALKGKGVDLERKKEIEEELEKIQEQLRAIRLYESERQYHSYLSQKEKYLDNKDSFLWTQQQKKQELKELESAFAEQERLQQGGVQTLQEAIRRLTQENDRIREQMLDYERRFKLEESIYSHFKTLIDAPATEDAAEFAIRETMDEMQGTDRRLLQQNGELRKKINRFTSLFSPDSFLNFPRSFDTGTDWELYTFVTSNLRPFLKENKIEIARQKLEEQHAGLITNIAKDIKDLSSRSEEIARTIYQINKDFKDSNFVGVVKSIELDYRETKSGIIRLLQKIRVFEEENSFGDQANLFKKGQTSEINKESIKLLSDLKNFIDNHHVRKVSMEDTFELLFRVQENRNNTGWVEKLSNVGSEGTDVLVKTMIYITLLNVFKEHAFKKEDDYWIHCVIDEVGKLSDKYLRDLIDFTNPKNIRLVFGSPNENDPLIYQHVYKIDRKGDQTQILELVGREV